MRKSLLIVLLCAMLGGCVYGASASGGSGGAFGMSLGTGIRF